MLKFLRYFLDFVKRNVVVDDPQCVYKFERSPGGDIHCTYLGRDLEWAFLPEWYYKKVFNS
ncbi:Decapping and exoribonuclease protein [Portunus trituberculatus]|uniref:Decapping and exoribonuclease protein n=2 Tax=Portunus trituberculatus TaxID=210409 RepID=A0A5B7I821_PORTR|nr:Decapping and exoribonuclease protein [Portunus trituberculatus]